MIKFSTAVLIREYTWFIALETILICFDSDSKRSCFKSLLHSINIICCHCHKVFYFYSSCITLIELAGAIFCRVRVSSFRHWVVAIHVVVKSNLLITTIATVAKLNTINKLLLGKLLEVAWSDLVSGLSGRNWGKSPAGSTITLVLDWGYCTFINPIDWWGCSSYFRGEITLCFNLFKSQKRFVLLLSPVWHLVVTKLITRVSGIVSLNERVFLCKLIETMLILSNCAIWFTILSDVAEECNLNFWSCGS